MQVKYLKMLVFRQNYFCALVRLGQEAADRYPTLVMARAAMAEALGIHVNFCGTRKNTKQWR